MSAAATIRALLAVARAAHAAYVNSDAAPGFNPRRTVSVPDYAALGRALYVLDMATGRKGREESGPLLAERALAPMLDVFDSPTAVRLSVALKDDDMAAIVAFQHSHASSQVHPDSALPSRPDYHAGFDNTAAQYGALASMRPTTGPWVIKFASPELRAEGPACTCESRGIVSPPCPVHGGFSHGR